MNQQFIPYKISYFVFSLVVSCFIVFAMNRKFNKYDVITVPLFAIVLYLIIDFSASWVYQKNVESFVTADDKEKEKEQEHDIEDVVESLTNQDEVHIGDSQLMKKFAAYAEDEDDGKHNIHPVPRPPIHSEEDDGRHNIHPVPEPHMPSGEEDDGKHNIHPVPKPPIHPEEEESQIIPPKPAPSTGGGAGKEAQAQQNAKQAPDVNRHRMSDGKGMSNRNLDTINPININVSYNTNRPFNVNEDPNLNYEAQLRMGKRDKDLSRFQFDSGLEKKNTASFETSAQGSLLSPVNPTTVNATLSNMNQSYYPAYLENPLNKNQPGTQIKSVFDNDYKRENKKMGDTLRQQNDYNKRAKRSILLRDDDYDNDEQDTVVKPKHWTQSNYELTQIQKILNEKNSPAPVLVNNPWSEWKPVNYN